MNSNPSVPPVDAYVDAFYIDEFEVTVAQYQECVAAMACEPLPDQEGCNWREPDREQHPSNCVSWVQAEAYCAWVAPGTKRLPTEAEWEKAAAGPDGWTYPWDNETTPTCTYVVMREVEDGCGLGSTWIVGSKDQGRSVHYDIADMVGNVSEWVADWYADPYIDEEPINNPTGPVSGFRRGVRGGSWQDDTNTTLSAIARASAFPDFGYTDIGFRCAMTPPDAR